MSDGLKLISLHQASASPIQTANCSAFRPILSVQSLRRIDSEPSMPIDTVEFLSATPHMGPLSPKASEAKDREM